jgi:amino acid permease
MQSIPIPGAFWVALVAAVVPALAVVLAQFFPESQYWWSPVIVAGLYAILKAVLVNVAGKASPPATPTAAAAARGVAPDDVAEATRVRGRVSRWLLG